MTATGQVTLTGAGALLTQYSDIAGGRVEIAASEWRNDHGTIQQIDASGHLVAAISGELDNTSGVIAGNGTSLKLTAGRLVNAEGGRITQDAEGSLYLLTGSLSGEKGKIETKGLLSLESAGLVDLTGALTQAKGIRLVAGGLEHVDGALLSTGDAEFVVDGAMNNRRGKIRISGNAAISTGGMDNSSGVVEAGGRLGLTALTKIKNENGSILAEDAVAVSADSLENSSGRVESLSDSLSVTVAGLATNQVGTLRSAQAFNLVANGLNNRFGTVSGGVVSVDVRGHALINDAGSILAEQSLAVSSGEINNQGGLLYSGGSLVAQTHGEALRSSTSAEVSGTQGIHAQGDLTIKAGHVLNASAISGKTLRFDVGGWMSNTSGSVLGTESLNITARNIQNFSGLLYAGNELTLVATGMVDNQRTNGGNKGIHGRSVSIQSTDMSNKEGLVAANGNLLLTLTNHLDNSYGTLSAGGVAAIADGSTTEPLAFPLFLDNASGRITGGQGISIRAHKLAHGGSIRSGGSLSLSLVGDQYYDAGTRIESVGDIILSLGDHSFSNAGILRSGGSLNISARTITNSNSGELSATATDLTAANQVDNRGLIEGDIVAITANAIENRGSGRIYGDDIVLRAESLVNQGEGGPAAVIAARGSLDAVLKADMINRGGALMYASGNMSVAAANLYNENSTIEAGWGLRLHSLGALENRSIYFGSGRWPQDASQPRLLPTLAFISSGADMELRAKSLINSGATIDVNGDLTLHADEIRNLNPYLEYRVVAGKEHVRKFEFEPPTRTVRYAPEEVRVLSAVGRYADDSFAGWHSEWGSDAEAGLEPFLHAFAPNMSNWSADTYDRQLLLPSKKYENGIFARYLGGLGGDIDGLADRYFRVRQSSDSMTTCSSGDEGGTCTPRLIPGAHYSSSDRIWSDFQVQPGDDAALDKALDDFYRDANSRLVSNFRAYDYNRTTERAVVTQSLPGRIVVGGRLEIQGSRILNDMSKVVDKSYANVGGDRVDNIEKRVPVKERDRGAMYETYDAGSSDKNIGVNYVPYEVQREREVTLTLEDASAIPRISPEEPPPGRSRALNVVPDRALHGIGLGGLSRKLLRGSTVLGNLGQELMGLVRRAAAEYDGGTDWHAVDLPSGPDKHAGRVVPWTRFADGPPAIDSTSKLPVGLNAAGKRVPDLGGTVARALDGRIRGGVFLPAPLPTPLSGPGLLNGQTLRTWNPNLTLPTNSLFHQRIDPTATYLVETDPRFASYRQWLSSDYLLRELSIDPTTAQKRLGDGFYEQRLMREQIGQLTGSRFLEGYGSDEETYLALLTNGATYAKQHQLRPGVALSAEQMEQLTTDLIWLVEHTVTLADGSTQNVLVPQVYLLPRKGDLIDSGALIAGKNMQMNLTGKFDNQGTLSVDKVLQLNAHDIANSGSMRGVSLALTAKQDINVAGGELKADEYLSLDAGRDVVVESTTTSASTATSQRTILDRVAKLTSGGVTLVKAGQDIHLNAASLKQTSTADGEKGGIQLEAGRDVKLGVAGTASRDEYRWDASNYRIQSQSQDLGTDVQADGNVIIKAGQDVVTGAANVNAKGDVFVDAKRDVMLMSGQGSETLDEATQRTKKSFLKSTTTTTRTQSERSFNQGSAFSGATVIMQAGQDIVLQGASVVSDLGTTLDAKRNVVLMSVTDTLNREDQSHTSTKGLFSSGGIGFTIGRKDLSRNGQVTQTSSVGSTVASVGGNVVIKAGESYAQVGSAVMAPGGDVLIDAKRAEFIEDREQTREHSETRFRQSGLTLAIGAPGVGAAQGAMAAAEMAGQVEDPRMKALAAATAAAKAVQAAKEAAKLAEAIASKQDDKGLSISITVGASQSRSSQTNTSDTSASSTVLAGGKVVIQAHGAGEDSNIQLRGADISGQHVVLDAENKLLLGSSQDTSSQTSSNESVSGSVGISASVGKKTQLGYTASASLARGQSDGSDLTQVNTRIRGGSSVTLNSGGDTHLGGAVVSAPQVKGDIKGNLILESKQDTATFGSKSGSASASVTVGYGAGASLSLSQTKASADYAAVAEQTGIRAGDDGFQLNVGGRTEFKGGAITSSQAAIDNNKNVFSTGSLGVEDIANHSKYSVTSITATVGVGGSAGSSMAGAFKDSGNESSVTRSALSGAQVTITGNDSASKEALAKLDRSATSDQQAPGLAKGWDGQKLTEQAQLAAQIVAQFGALASKEVGSYATDKRDSLEAQAREADARGDRAKGDSLRAEAAKWDDGGSYRVALHAAVGGLTGDLQGAVGATAGATVAPIVFDELQKAGVDKQIQEAVTALASTVAGVAAGGTAGGAAAFNEEENNFKSGMTSRRVRNIVTQESVRLNQACYPDCTEADYLRIDRQLSRLASAATIAEVADTSGGITESLRQELTQLLVELIPLFGTAESLVQAVTGKSTVTGEEANRWLAAVGALPMVGVVLKRAPEVARALADEARTLLDAGKTAEAAEKLSEAGRALGNPHVDAKAMAERLDALAAAEDVKSIEIVGAGTKGDWDKAVNGQLQPERAYVLTNGHAYMTDAAGRVKEVDGELSLTKMDRNGYQQCTTGKCGDAGDEGGHLIAAALGGAGDGINIVPQAATLNRGEWRAMERELQKALAAGSKVSIKIEVIYPPGAGVRPTGFRVVANIDGVTKPYEPFFQ